MADQLLDSLSGEDVLQSNSIATVTAAWVLVKNPDRHKRVVLSLHSIHSVRRVRTTYPGLLVIASAVSLIAAAAAYSKEGNGAGIPLGIVAAIFGLVYVASRRGSVCFEVEGEEFCTVNGTLTEARDIADAVAKAQEKARQAL
jgi:hypothetical protein